MSAHRMSLPRAGLLALAVALSASTGLQPAAAYAAEGIEDPVASGDQDPPRTDAAVSPSGERDVRAARGHYREAMLLRKAGKLEAALEKLETAYAELPTPTLLFLIAELDADLHRPQEGLAALSRYRSQLAPSSMPSGQGLSQVEALERRLAMQLLAAAASRDSAAKGSAPSADSAAEAASVSNKVRAPAPAAESVPKVAAAAAPALSGDSGRFFPGTPTWVSAGLTLGSFVATAALGGVSAQRQKDCAANFFCASSGYLPVSVFDPSPANEVARLQSATWAMLGVSGGLLSITIAATLVEYSQHKRKRAALVGSVALPAPSGTTRLTVGSW